MAGILIDPSREMKDREIYSEIRVAPPVAVRVDGRGFRRVLEELGYEKPYDKRFAEAMAGAAELFFKNSGLNPKFAYAFSDEVTIFFLEVPFNKRIEKINSIIPSFFSSALTILLGLKHPLAFDSRIIPLPKEDILGYLVWRQDEAWRNCINSYGLYLLIKNGLKRREAAQRMKHMKSSEVHELAYQHGINLGEVPAWQRRGILLYKETYEKMGYDPIKREETITLRSRVKQDWEPPLFRSEEGAALVKKLIA